MPEIVSLLVSRRHRYVGRPSSGDAPHPVETVPLIQLRAGLGIVGDRYFNRPAHRDAAVTVMSAESIDPWHAGLAQARRNILLRGVDVDAGPDRVLALDSGDGAVRLQMLRRANPCAWMDAAIAPGAWKALRGRGGMRCVPMDDGVLRVGPVRATWL